MCQSFRPPVNISNVFENYPESICKLLQYFSNQILMMGFFFLISQISLRKLWMVFVRKNEQISEKYWFTILMYAKQQIRSNETSNWMFMSKIKWIFTDFSFEDVKLEWWCARNLEVENYSQWCGQIPKRRILAQACWRNSNRNNICVDFINTFIKLLAQFVS